jgi:isopropylmalate/homocitrate/citramalate synthase
MATIEVSGTELLKAVQQLEPEEFDEFMTQAISLRSRSKEGTLSAAESKLIKQINRGLLDKLSNRYKQLVQKRKRGTLTDDELGELLDLTHQSETNDAERAAALLELANLRHIPIRLLMKQMEIKAAPLQD